MSTEWIKERASVVTGASSGLGRALALELVGRGLTVAGIGRDAERLEQTRALAAAQSGPGHFHPFPLDISDAEAVAAEFARIEDRLGPIALLINNAAIHPRQDFLDETPESFMQGIRNNLGGTVACTHAALRSMTQTGQGRIVNVISFADQRPDPACGVYAVSKGAIRIFSRALVADLADRFPRIVLSDWAPGILATGMGRSDGIPPEQAAKWGATLALWHDPMLNGMTFDRDQQLLPPQSLGQRLKRRMMLRGPVRPLRLD